MSYTISSLLDALSLVLVVMAVQQMAAMLMTVQNRLGMTPRSVAPMQMMKPSALKALELGALKSVLKAVGLVAVQIVQAETGRPVLPLLSLQRRSEMTPCGVATPAA